MNIRTRKSPISIALTTIDLDMALKSSTTKSR